jgi:predicted nuclease of predicted toxin-antitoxin system
MRLKVDENLPRETCDLLDRAGRDAIGVGQQGLAGADDARVYRLCQDERRALVTLDVDFANVQAYDPKSSAGVIVLREQTAAPRRRGADVAGAGSRAAGEAAVVVEEDRIRIREQASGAEALAQRRNHVGEPARGRPLNVASPALSVHMMPCGSAPVWKSSTASASICSIFPLRLLRHGAPRFSCMTGGHRNQSPAAFHKLALRHLW